MAYSELVKSLDHIRSYMREFYVYGFKSRDAYDGKSPRSYDDEKRRMESWLGAYMAFRRTAEGKVAFLSIDSRTVRHNPFFHAWKAKSFTNGDITLHFILFDILASAAAPLSLTEIIEQADTAYLSHFRDPMLLDESTVRKKLKEYIEEGLITAGKDGKRAVYSLPKDGSVTPPKELLDFYSEVAPCGVVGSYLLDKAPRDTDAFAFKHHYMAHAIDSDILCRLFSALSQEAYVELSLYSPKKRTERTLRVLPLQIYISVQSGRQYLMAWYPDFKCLSSYRLDYILDVVQKEREAEISVYKEKLARAKPHMWGVISQSCETRYQHIEFCVHADDDESHIYRRLLREKRCGRVEVLDAHTYRFSADVYDINEMVPWIRSFLCRITDLQMEDKLLEARFRKDIQKMYDMYGIGGDGCALS